MSTEKIFCDPLHSLIEFNLPEEEYLIRVIATKTFQRLRRIKQLGVSSFVFHGAEHSRFTHSLGVTYLTKRILTSLKDHYRTDTTILSLLKDNEKAILLAALLHDTGHGPFSHLFEAAAPASVRQSHEKWTMDIITHPESDIGKILASIDGGINNEVASIIARTHPCKFAVDLISSQLDADRMDYLLRDSLMTGAGYGQFDVEWLLKALRIGPDGGICVDGRKGIGAVENYMHSRYLMYIQVYFHKTGRAFEGQLIKILAMAGRLLCNGSKKLGDCCSRALRKALSNEEVTLGDYLSLDDTVLLSAIHRWTELDCDLEHSLLAKNCRDFYLRRVPWKSFSIGAEEFEQVKECVEDLNHSLHVNKHLLANSIYFDSCKTSMYKGIDYYTSHDGNEHSGAIMVLNDGVLSPLETEKQAAAVQAMSKVSWVAHRLYYDREMKTELVKALKEYGITVQERS